MKPIVYCLAALSLTAFGCAGSARHASTTAAEAHAAAATSDAPVSPATDAPADAAALEASSPESRKTGDFVVFSFEGSFYKNPLKLTERVVDRDADSITIELSLTEKGKTSDVLRVRSSTTKERHGDVLAVEKAASEGKFVTAKTADYDALMAKTMASADSNDSIVDSTDDVVTIHQTRIPVTKTRYRVKIGKQAATMSTLASQSFSWGDLGGEIKTDGGSLVYRASLVDMGDSQGTVATLAAPTTAN